MKANEANDSAIYNVIVSWIHTDKESRSEDFLELLFLVDFTKLKVDFIEKIMLSELVTENLACLKIVTKKFVSASKTDIMKQTAETTRVICVGGSKKPSKIFEAHNFVNEPRKECQDLTLRKKEELLFAEKREGCIFLGTRNRSFSWSETKIWKLHLRSKNWKPKQVNENYGLCAPMITDATCIAVTKQKIIEGCQQTTFNFVQPHINRWVEGPTFNERILNSKCVTCKSCLYVLGGYNDKTLSSVEQLLSK